MIDGRDPYTSDGPAGVCDRIDIRDLGEDDVSSLIACIRRCYGESYTEPGLYDPDHVRRELRAGRLLSVGALAGSRVVGHIGTLIRKPGDTVGDTIGGIVDPDYRGQGLLLQMGRQLFAGYQHAASSLPGTSPPVCTFAHSARSPHQAQWPPVSCSAMSQQRPNTEASNTDSVMPAASSSSTSRPMAASTRSMSTCQTTTPS